MVPNSVGDGNGNGNGVGDGDDDLRRRSDIEHWL